MHITFQNPGFEHSIKSISLFQAEDQTPFWSDSLLYFYPQIDAKELALRSSSDRSQYLHEKLSIVYKDLKEELAHKVIRYNEHFAQHKKQIEDALSDAFECDVHPILNDLTGNLTLNPVCPRFLKEHCFDVFYKNSERGALGISIHEAIHYIWFLVWNQHFGDSYDEYETPSLKWILSEMVVEAIMSDPRLSSINPYFPRENGGCVYPYFQNMIINNMPILDTMHDLYRKHRITTFMETAYAYCVRYEEEIRRHIAEAEKTF